MIHLLQLLQRSLDRRPLFRIQRQFQIKLNYWRNDFSLRELDLNEIVLEFFVTRS
jgi:hypothetical protein